jgi:hypothetical protein
MARRWKIASVAVGLFAAGGAGAAFATAGDGHARPAVSGTPVSAYSAPLRHGFGFRAAGGGLAAAASYLGTTPMALVDQLRSGKTLAQIANQTSGKSADGLIAALAADAKQKLAAAVTAGKLTQTQANTITANLQQWITDLVNGTRATTPGPFRHGFGFHGDAGPHGHWGSPPGSATT